MKVLAVLGALSFVLQPVFFVLLFIGIGLLKLAGVETALALVPILLVALAGAVAATWAVLHAAFKRWHRRTP